MLGLQISRRSTSVWSSISALLAAVSLAVGIGIGPKAVFLVSGVGFGVSILAIWIERQPDKGSRRIFPMVTVGIHVCFLAIALGVAELVSLALVGRSIENATLGAPVSGS